MFYFFNVTKIEFELIGWIGGHMSYYIYRQDDKRTRQEA